MRKYLWDYAQLFAIAGVVVLLDQLTKFWVRLKVPTGMVYRPESWLSQFARIIHLRNRGAALGMLQDFNVIFLVLGIIFSLFIIFYYPRIPRKDWRLRLALGLLLGGALGNPIDRLLYQGYVTDFISLWNLPVFNLADASVLIGMAILMLGMWIQERHNKMASR